MFRPDMLLLPSLCIYNFDVFYSSSTAAYSPLRLQRDPFFTNPSA